MLCLLGPAIGEVEVEYVEIDILLLNTNFFFDNEKPHGAVVGKSVPVPTAEQYEEKAKGIAKLIDTREADIVGLAEVENQAVLEKLKSYLANPYD